MSNCSCVDTTFFVFFFCLFLAVTACLVYTWVEGDPQKVLNNVDSSGNLCGAKNADVDLSDKPLLFLFDSYYFPHDSFSICTEKCPQNDLTSKVDLISYTNNTKHELCHYELNIAEYLKANFKRQGSCPAIPVLKSVEWLKFCVPEVSINSGQLLAFVDLVVPLLHQCFRSVANYWTYNLLAVISALLLASIIFVMLRCFSNYILFSVLPINVLGIATGLASLWYAFHVTCRKMTNSSENKLPLSKLEIYNEIVLFCLAIFITFALLSIVLIFLINCRSFPSEINNLFKIFAKFLDSSKIILWIPPIGSIVMLLALTGAVASAYCALGLVDIEYDKDWSDFYQLPSSPLKSRPERAGVGFAVVLALLWFPRLICTSFRLACHVSASEFLLNAPKDFKPVLTSNQKPPVISLMSTAVTISFAETFLWPLSFISAFLLAMTSPCENCCQCFNNVLRACAYWVDLGYASQCEINAGSAQFAYYKAISSGTSRLNSASFRARTAFSAGKWFLSTISSSIIALAMAVVIFQMRYHSFIDLVSPSLFLVGYYGYWIAAITVEPLQAAFTTFSLNYDTVLQLLGEKQTRKLFTNDGQKQNEINLMKMGEKN